MKTLIEEKNCFAMELGLTINERIADFGVFKIELDRAKEWFQSTLPNLMN